MTEHHGLPPVSLHELREQVTAWFYEAMRRIDVRNTMTHVLTVRDGALQGRGLLCPLAGKRRIVLLAVGKAAVPMCTVLAELIEPELTEQQELVGLAVSIAPSATLPSGVRYIMGSHPFPGRGSRESAHEAIALVSGLSAEDLVIFLLSGGASSLFELPLDLTLSIEAVEEFYRALVHSGLPIAQINALRKHLSAVKGGKLAALAAPADQCTLIVSDVPGKAYDMVGSGPSLPDSSTLQDCASILSDPAIASVLPSRVLALLRDPALPETPKKDDRIFMDSRILCLLDNDILLEHVAAFAAVAGYYAVIDNTPDDWDYRHAAQYLLDRLVHLRRLHPKVCLISGGEISVKVSKASGTGGRNQHFALHFATLLQMVDLRVVALSAGSDGIDGNSVAAGAIIDSETKARLELIGLSAEEALANFNSHTVLSALSDCVVISPTENNVRDIRIFVSA